MAGYGRQSSEQIDALVRASLDPDDNVRNDAVRALAVLAGAKPNLAQKISPEPFDTSTNFLPLSFHASKGGSR